MPAEDREQLECGKRTSGFQLDSSSAAALKPQQSVCGPPCRGQGLPTRSSWRLLIMGPCKGCCETHSFHTHVTCVQTPILCSSVQGPGWNADSPFRMVVNTLNPTASGIS